MATQEGQGPQASTWSSGHQCLGGAWGLAPGWAPPHPEATCRQAVRQWLGAPLPDGPPLPPEESPPQPRLEDEIDLLAQELARQEAGRWKLTALPQPEAPHRLLEAGEPPLTPPPAPTRSPPTTPARPGPAVITPPLCSRHPGALRPRPGPRPGPPLHSGSPCAHDPYLLGFSRVVWACAHVPPGPPGWTRRRLHPR